MRIDRTWVLARARQRLEILNQDRGVVLLWTAAALVALLGFAALAVDVSGFLQQARSQQRASDLACLAGAQELPEAPAAAAAKVIEYLAPNQPGLAGIAGTAPISGTAGAGLAVWQTGNFRVEVETPYLGSATKMRVTITQTRATDFGQVMGFESVDILEQAACEVGSALGGAADQPFGVLTGFTGGLINFEKNECTLDGETNSKCSGLAIPRNDNPSGSQFGIRTANNYIANMVAGINWGIAPPSDDILCQTVNPGPPQPCNRVAVVSGDEPSKLYNGLISGKSSLGFVGDEIGYLEKHHTVLCHGSDCYDGHELEEVADCTGGCPAASDADGWTDSTSTPVVTITHVADCDCPRFSRIPVVQSFPPTSANCSSAVFDPDDPDAVNTCSAKIIDFAWVYLMRPFFETDFDNAGLGQKVTTIAAVRLVFDENVTVDGDCFSEFKEGAPKAVRLIPA